MSPLDAGIVIVSVLCACCTHFLQLLCSTSESEWAASAETFCNDTLHCRRTCIGDCTRDNLVEFKVTKNVKAARASCNISHFFAKSKLPHILNAKTKSSEMQHQTEIEHVKTDTTSELKVNNGTSEHSKQNIRDVTSHQKVCHGIGCTTSC